eukprot:321734_1
MRYRVIRTNRNVWQSQSIYDRQRRQYHQQQDDLYESNHFIRAILYIRSSHIYFGFDVTKLQRMISTIMLILDDNKGPDAADITLYLINSTNDIQGVRQSSSFQYILRTIFNRI